MRFLARLILALALVAPQQAFALDPGKVPPITLGTGSTGDASNTSVTVNGASQSLKSLIPSLAPLASPTFTGTATVPKISVTGPGSTGDVSGMSVTAPVSGALSVAQKDRLTVVTGRDFGAVPNTGTDMTAALNLALSKALSERKPLYLEKGYYGVSQSGTASDGRPYALLSKAVDVIGQGANAIDTVIYPLAGTANNVDILRVEAPSGLGENFTLRGFSINPGASGSKYGGVALFMFNPEGGNLSKVLIDNFRAEPGNDYSFYAKGVPSATTPQGVMANSLIQRSYFADGFKGEAMGDSILWQSVVFRTSSSTRATLDYTVTNYNASFPSGIANLASDQTFVNCNFDSLGPIAVLHNGRHYNFIAPNMEISQPNATGGPNNAMIDIRGDVGPVVHVEFRGGHMGLFGGGSATKFFNLGNVQNFLIDGTSLSNGMPSGVATGINITSGAVDTALRSFRTNHSTFASVVSDAGIGTMGVRKTLPLAPNMTTQAGYDAPGFIKDETGTVRLFGLVNVGATGGAALVGNMPAAFAPSTAQRVSVVLQSGGATTLDIFADGRVYYNGSANQQFSLNGATFQVNPVAQEVIQNH